MGTFDRIILCIYTLLSAFVSLGVVLLSLRLIPLELVWTGISHIIGQWEVGLAGAIFLLISIRLLLASARTRHAKDTIVHHTDMGDVHISLDAIKNLVEKTARHTRGVRGVKVRVTHDGQGLKVYLKAVVSPENNVPSVSEDLQKKVHEYIKNTVGVELVDVQILVENISNDFKVKQRVE